MRTVIIIQARMGSTRLPGKVMEDIAGKPVLAHVIERCKAAKNANDVVVAVPKELASLPLTEVARKSKVNFFLGDERNVLDRYYGAAVSFSAHVIVRVTADCPLLDPQVVDNVIQLLNHRKADYASNVHPRSFPKGLDVEAFTMEALIAARLGAREGDDTEHVTPWIIRHKRRACVASGNAQLAEYRWTLDYPEDLEFLRAVAERAGHLPMSMGAVVALLNRCPELTDINKKWRKAA